jgi:tRNA pseudouridine65 synthase
LPLTLLAEGPGWVVIAKPPGLAVHPNEWVRGSKAVLQRLRRQLGRRVYPIHRLDLQVSGCLLFATEQGRAGELSAALTSGRKTYLALVRGYFQADAPVRVETPMLDDNGILKDAASTVRCLGRSHDPRCSLLAVEPHTGRYHQVRRHVRDLNHPVIGDGQHGDGRVNRWWRESFDVQRLMLHCLSLEVPLPDGDIVVRAPLWVDMAAVCRRLPFWEEGLAPVEEPGAPA